jgi:hypothetical protein
MSNRLYQEVIQHLAAPDGVDLDITVEITVSKKDGFPDDQTRLVSENARTQPAVRCGQMSRLV